MLSKSEVSDDIKSIEVFLAGFFSVKLSMVNGVVVLQDKLNIIDRIAITFFSKNDTKTTYKLFFKCFSNKGSRV